MVKLEVAAERLNLRTEPSSAKGQATVIEVLPRGSIVEQIDYVKRDPSWVKATASSGHSGFVKRLLLYQVEPRDLDHVDEGRLTAYNDAIWQSTAQYEAVTYLLGAKDPRGGTVDCSGWIAFINRLAFSAVNKTAGEQLVTDHTLARLNTHSDHQVSLTGYSAMQIFSVDSVTALLWRPGLLIGINFSDYDWEKNQGRVFEIDHIVQTMQSPDGALYITQSSSSGGGVNKVLLQEWLRGTEKQRVDNRLHVVDAFSLCASPGAAGSRGLGSASLELEELDTSSTPAG